jgi:hypothetical protein
MPLVFPEWFPDACPPASAIDAGGEVFRVVAGGELIPADFESHYEKGTALRAPACRRCAVSVFDSFSGACHLLKIKPSLGTEIAAGVLLPTAGKMEYAGSPGHIEWWPYSGVDRPSFFREPVRCP